jgi:hypothetical protein
MTVLFIEGFDWTSTVGDLSRKWNRGANPNNVGTPYSRWAVGGGIRSVGSNQYVWHQFPSGYATMMVAFAQYIYSGSPGYSAAYPFLRLRDSDDTTQLRFHWDASDIVVYRGDGTLLGTASSVLQNETWLHLQIKVYIHDSAGTVEIKLNETTVLNLTSQDTRNGLSTVDSFQIYYVQGLYTLYDDVYVTDGEFLGDCQVKGYLPDDDGNHVDWNPSTGSDHYAMVDEADPDDDSTYNTGGGVVGLKDTYKVTPSGPGRIEALAINSMVRRTGAMQVTVKNLIRQGGSDYQSSESKIAPVGYGVLQSIHETDPDDSGRWTNAKVTSGEFGLEITNLTTSTTTTTTTTTTT